MSWKRLPCSIASGSTEVSTRRRPCISLEVGSLLDAVGVNVAQGWGDSLSEKLPAGHLTIRLPHPIVSPVAENSDSQILTHFRIRSASPFPDAVLSEIESPSCGLYPPFTQDFRQHVCHSSASMPACAATGISSPNNLTSALAASIIPPRMGSALAKVPEVHCFVARLTEEVQRLWMNWSVM